VVEILDAPITFGHLIAFWLANTLMTIFGAVLNSQRKKLKEID